MFNECESQFNLDRHLLPFLQESPFFAEISRHLYKCPTTDIPTAAVTYDPRSEQIVLYYNPDFMKSLSNLQIKGVLKHEFYHLIFGHLHFRRRTPPQLWNIATDLAINSIIVNNSNYTSKDYKNRSDGPLPSFALIPGRWPWNPEGREYTDEEKKGLELGQIISEFPEMKASEWYFNKILEKASKSGAGSGLSDLLGGSGKIDSMDDHEGWDKVPEDQREIIEGRVKAIVEKAVRHADQHSNGWGSIPSDLREDIRRSVSRIVDWRGVLRQFVGSITRGHRSTSIKRINKRYPYIHPGVKRGYVAKLIIAIDMSGSVDNKMLELFFGELASLTKKVDIDILPFDCYADVKDIYTWKRGTSIKTNRSKQGGTDFNAPTNVVNDPKNRGRWDGMLVMTDGECSAPVGSRTKRGWILGKGCKLNFSSSELQIFLDDGKQLTGAWR